MTKVAVVMPTETLPEGWTATRISEMATLINGFPFASELFTPEGEVPLVRIRDVIATNFETFVPAAAVPDTAWIRRDDLLIGMDGDFNTVLWKREPAAMNQRVCLLRARGGNDIRFIAYLLPPILKMVNDLTYATTVKHLSSGHVISQRTVRPPLAVQRQIADYLDAHTAKIDMLIEKQERLIETLAERRQAVISHAVTKGLDPNAPMRDSGIEWAGEIPRSWFVGQVKNAGEVTLGKMIQPASKSASDFKAPYMRAANVQPDGEFALDDVKQMWFSGPELTQLDILQGDVVVVEGGMGGFGRSAFVSSSLEGWGFQNSINRIRPNSEVDGQYLTYLLLTARSMGFMRAIASAVSMPHLTAEKLNKMRIPMPPGAEQAAIANLLNKERATMNALSAKAREMIDVLKERRQALISAAVTGKIDVRGLS